MEPLSTAGGDASTAAEGDASTADAPAADPLMATACLEALPPGVFARHVAPCLSFEDAGQLFGVKLLRGAAEETALTFARHCGIILARSRRSAARSARRTDGQLLLMQLAASKRLWGTLAASDDVGVVVRHGRCYTFGRGKDGLGRLADDDDWPACGTPRRVCGLSGVRAVACGCHFVVAIDSAQTLWAWGANDVGQLGVGDLLDRPKPTRVSAGATAVAAHGARAACVAEGRLFVWGEPFKNGPAVTTPRRLDVEQGDAAVQCGFVSVALGYSFGSAVTAHGGLVCFGQDFAPPRRIPLRGVVQAAVGHGHCLALVRGADGQRSVFGFGENDHGQIAPRVRFVHMRDTALSEARPRRVDVGGRAAVVSVHAGHFSSAVVCANGTLWLWGDGTSGELASEMHRGDPVPAALVGVVAYAGLANCVAATSHGLYAWGRACVRLADAQGGEANAGGLRIIREATAFHVVETTET